MFEIARIREVFRKVLRTPDLERDLDGRYAGESALLSFTVDDTGHLFKDSTTLSSCAWAVGRTLKPGPGSSGWLDGFDKDHKNLLALLLGIGDGRIKLTDSPAGTGRKLGTVAGVATRVALDLVTGGITGIPALVGLALTPAIGQLGGKAIEKVGEPAAKRAAEALTNVVENKGRSGVDGLELDPESPVGSKMLTIDDLAALTRGVADALGVSEALEPATVRIKRWSVSTRYADDAASDEFLNSFYADDLQHVAESIAAVDPGRALTAYLTPAESIDTTRRVDVRSDPATLLRSVSPRSMPPGRWPADPAHPLTLSQQFAVNEMLNGLGSSESRGLYAVNGPPGTGKTTMLRDLIAAIVVERASRLAKLGKASDAFASSELTWRPENVTYTKRIRPLIPELTGFEIVVASSNNGAVENITLEVPSVAAVNRESFPDADYLSGPATVAADRDCWGAVAARLGKRSHRRRFVEAFWWYSPANDNEEVDSSIFSRGSPPPRTRTSTVSFRGRRPSSSSILPPPRCNAWGMRGSRSAIYSNVSTGPTRSSNP
ncbi:hypothetical protein [Nocardia sp. N2S4-5]|uniref:hypothetical protein n=1 Tax=Nocardia sp. N2S4-5 TaxID=3351565 RepID=UPI0037D2C6A4